MSDRGNVSVFGIDPAPAKGLAIWSRKGVEYVAAHDARDWLNTTINQHEKLLIAWDAPISFDQAVGYSQRPVEKAVSAFLRRPDISPRFEKGAISVRPFSGCPHWTITCDVLGLPFGNEKQRVQIAKTADELLHPGHYVIEVHPAVSLGILWLEKDLRYPMPQYKGNKGACGIISSELGFPTDAAANDDALDAYVSYAMALSFIDGSACWVGDTVKGGFVLPISAESKWKLASTRVK